VEGERKGGEGEREGIEVSFSEEQGAERRTHALHARWIDRHQTLSTHSLCLVTFVDRSSSE
jgi:hypothetical protein